jgi:hypothetical protein
MLGPQGSQLLLLSVICLSNKQKYHSRGQSALILAQIVSNKSSSREEMKRSLRGYGHPLRLGEGERTNKRSLYIKKPFGFAPLIKMGKKLVKDIYLIYIFNNISFFLISLLKFKVLIQKGLVYILVFFVFFTQIYFPKCNSLKNIFNLVNIV